MNVLVACEESQAVCTAFRERGHNAFSCDIQECSGGHPEWHIMRDCTTVLNGNCTFRTLDGTGHVLRGKWDLIIAHPPCTYISAASAVRLFNTDHTIKDVARFQKLKESVIFFKKFLDADCDRIAIENPTPLKIAGLPKYTQIIEPFFFGDPWRKRTCLWLKNLPVLEATNMVKPVGYWVGAHGHNKAKNGISKGFRNPKMRAKTFPGIARAMAEQWGVNL